MGQADMVDLFNVQMFLALVVAGVAGLMFATSMLSARRYRNAKLALAGGAFLVFVVKGAAVLWWGLAAYDPEGLLATFPGEVALLLGLDVAILALMYLSVAKR